MELTENQKDLIHLLKELNIDLKTTQQIMSFLETDNQVEQLLWKIIEMHKNKQPLTKETIIEAMAKTIKL